MQYFKCKITNGKIIPELKREQVRLIEWSKRNEGKVIRLVVKIFRKNRSLDQNAYYWWMLHLVQEDTGMDANDTHEWMKKEFLSRSIMITNSKGEIIEEKNITGSSAILKTNEFCDYMERTRVFLCQFLEMQIPLPNEVPLEELERFYSR